MFIEGRGGNTPAGYKMDETLAACFESLKNNGIHIEHFRSDSAAYQQLVVEVAEVGFWFWLSRRRRAQTGAEALPGARGVVVVACRPEGQVRVLGELWRARCEEGADPGDEVVVERLEPELLLVVSKTRQVGN